MHTLYSTRIMFTEELLIYGQYGSKLRINVIVPKRIVMVAK